MLATLESFLVSTDRLDHQTQLDLLLLKMLLMQDFQVVILMPMSSLVLNAGTQLNKFKILSIT